MLLGIRCVTYALLGVECSVSLRPVGPWSVGGIRYPGRRCACPGLSSLAPSEPGAGRMRFGAARYGGVETSCFVSRTLHGDAACRNDIGCNPLVWIHVHGALSPPVAVSRHWCHLLRLDGHVEGVVGVLHRLYQEVVAVLEDATIWAVTGGRLCGVAGGKGFWCLMRRADCRMEVGSGRGGLCVAGG